MNRSKTRGKSMRISYQYRLNPNKEQREIIDNTLDMLRCQYNYQLAQRFDRNEQNRCSIDRCTLVCLLPELAKYSFSSIASRI